MTPLASQLLFNAAAAGVLAFVAWLLGRWVRDPRVRHVLWLIPLLRLVAPPLPSFLPTATEPVRTWGSSVASSVAGSLTSADIPLVQEHWSSDWPLLLVAVWAAGAMLTLALGVVRSARLAHQVRFATEPGPELEHRIHQVAQGVGLERVPRTKVLNSVIPPMIWSIGARSLLLLPKGLVDRLSTSELDAVVAHELIHVRRRDPWVRMVEFVVAVVFWWYPVATWIRREVERTREVLCDAAVSDSLSSDPRPYAEGLIKTLDFLSTRHCRPYPAACGVNDYGHIEERLRMIMKPTYPHRLSRRLRWALGSCAVALVLLSPGFATRGTTAVANDHEARVAAASLTEAPALLEIRATSTTPLDGYELYRVADGDGSLYLSPEVTLTDMDVQGAKLDPVEPSASGEEEDSPAIMIQFTKQGARAFAELTREHMGEQLAIVIEGRLVSAPTVRDEIQSGRAMVTGSFSREEAQRIVDGLNSHVR
ncbi:MAG: M48 family metalloprotease [Candidatus Eisenbacteria bacterium]|uniref:M48 family metalloprotease n=1 Tax=Eiseniibacteriota bacterium TaxID=2212470 RepID=A0A956NFI3_UNCEI|nr:M48 family metalloprotease [Candidatus Eisenbacteria bacterium]